MCIGTSLKQLVNERQQLQQKSEKSQKRHVFELILRDVCKCASNPFWNIFETEHDFLQSDQDN